MNWKTYLKKKGARVGVIVVAVVLVLALIAGALGGRAGFLTNLDGIVRTVIDVDRSVGGYISGSGATAMVLGDFTLMQQGCVRFGYLAEGMSIFTGDTVLTSGKGGAQALPRRQA